MRRRFLCGVVVVVLAAATSFFCSDVMGQSSTTHDPYLYVMYGRNSTLGVNPPYGVVPVTPVADNMVPVEIEPGKAAVGYAWFRKIKPGGDSMSYEGYDYWAVKVVVWDVGNRVVAINFEGYKTFYVPLVYYGNYYGCTSADLSQRCYDGYPLGDGGYVSFLGNWAGLAKGAPDTQPASSQPTTRPTTMPNIVESLMNKGKELMGDESKQVVPAKKYADRLKDVFDKAKSADQTRVKVIMIGWVTAARDVWMGGDFWTKANNLKVPKRSQDQAGEDVVEFVQSFVIWGGRVRPLLTWLRLVITFFFGFKAFFRFYDILMWGFLGGANPFAMIGVSMNAAAAHARDAARGDLNMDRVERDIAADRVLDMQAANRVVEMRAANAGV
jgi:hypothetical protein